VTFEAIARSRERFVTFFPVAAALKRGAVTFAGSAAIPPQAQKFPLLRQRGKVLADGAVADWWLFDGSRQWRVGRLASDQALLSIAEVVNDTLLRERIDSDWRPKQVEPGASGLGAGLHSAAYWPDSRGGRAPRLGRRIVDGLVARVTGRARPPILAWPIGFTT